MALPVSASPSAVTTTTPGNWQHIQYSSTSSGSLQYCDILYATKGVWIANVSPTIQHNVIQYFTTQGIYIAGASAARNVQYNTICNGGVQGIYVIHSHPTYLPTLRNNTIGTSGDAMTYGFERYNGTSGLVVSFQNNTIRYTSSSGAAIKVTSATVEIVNNTITNNSSHGIWNKDNGSPDIHDNNINTNSKNRIYVEQSSPTNIKWNNIQGNGLCGIILLSTCSATYFSTLMQNKWNNIYNNTKYELSSLKTAHFMAENQFWNLFQYPPIDNQVNGDVDFSPWKTTANPDAGPGGSIGKLLAEERTSSEEVIVPTEFSLGANFPNPFNPETIIPYALPGDAQVTIKIFNLLGEEVAVLFDRHQTAGFHRILWTGKNDSGTIVASGIYCYRLEAQATAGDNFFAIRKMILLR